MKLIYLTSIVSLAGCASNTYLVENEKSYSPDYEEKTVCVTNPDFGDQYQTLVESEIYEIADGGQCDNKLTLKESWRGAVCGNPLLASAIVLGTIPVSLPITDTIRYTIENENGITEYEHSIETYDRISIWEWFIKPFTKSRDDLLVEGLKQSERNEVEKGLTKLGN